MSSLERDPRINRAIGEILTQYGHRVSVEAKSKNLIKFGRYANLGTSYETVQEQGGMETFLTDNLIDTVSSSNTGDDQTVGIEGHTINGTDLTFVSQSLTLDGQNKVLLSTPLARMTRITNNGTTDLAGIVYGYEDDTLSGGVPQTAAKIHAQASGLPYNQTQKCSTSLSYQDYWIVTQVCFSVEKQNSRTVDFILQSKAAGGVWKSSYPTITVNSNASPATIDFNPCLIFRPNSDVRMIAISSATATGVSAFISGYLAIVQNP